MIPPGTGNMPAVSFDYRGIMQGLQQEKLILQKFSDDMMIFRQIRNVAEQYCLPTFYIWLHSKKRTWVSILYSLRFAFPIYAN